MRHLILAGALLAALAWGSPQATAGTPTKEEMRAAAAACQSVNGVCPVMGNLVQPGGGSAIYDGEKVAFCCPGCVKKFNADPMRYMDLMRLNAPKYWYVSKKPAVVPMRKAKAALKSANGRCPVMGRLVVAGGGTATYGKQTIAFCCPGCAPQFEKSPEKYLRLMRADPLAYAYDRPGPTNAQLRAARESVKSANGLCPVMGRLVTATGGAATYKEQDIAFCCPGCAEKFHADPEAYMAKMRAEPAVYGYVSPQR